MKKILILTVVMGIGMVFLSQDAKAQVANNSNVNTPITATVGVNLPTAQTQNGTVSVEGGAGAGVTIPPAPPAAPPVSVAGGGGVSVTAPSIPEIPGGTSTIINPGTVTISFTRFGDFSSVSFTLSGYFSSATLA
jgi:hypothetical protein